MGHVSGARAHVAIDRATVSPCDGKARDFTVRRPVVEVHGTSIEPREPCLNLDLRPLIVAPGDAEAMAIRSSLTLECSR